MKTAIGKHSLRQRRHARVRARIVGTAARPRLSVHRSLRGMYAQIIDDTVGKTMAAVHSNTDGKSGEVGERAGKVAQSYRLGQALAAKAKAMNIDAVVFDRGGYRYHGRVKALADGARDGGLQF